MVWEVAETALRQSLGLPQRTADGIVPGARLAQRRARVHLAVQQLLDAGHGALEHRGNVVEIEPLPGSVAQDESWSPSLVRTSGLISANDASLFRHTAYKFWMSLTAWRAAPALRRGQPGGGVRRTHSATPSTTPAGSRPTTSPSW